MQYRCESVRKISSFPATAGEAVIRSPSALVPRSPNSRPALRCRARLLVEIFHTLVAVHRTSKLVRRLDDVILARHEQSRGISST
jgi:hypothetical protein